jgi:SAM-dependent methyltransferase
MGGVVEQAGVGNPLATAGPWNGVSAAYTAELLPQFERFSRDALALNRLPASPRIVDIACGPGTLAILAAREGASVSAVDISRAMIASLRRRAGEGAVVAVSAQVGDAQALPFADDTFDAAFCMFGLIFVPDRAAGFREMRRVLRPGCPAVVGSWAPATGPFAALSDAIRISLPDLPLPEKDAPLSDPRAFQEELSAAGFREARIHTVTHTFPARSPAEFWAVVQRTTAPVALLRARLGEESWPGVARAIFERFHGAVGDGPLEHVATAHLGLGTK